jgi:hypothetical protein
MHRAGIRRHARQCGDDGKSKVKSKKSKVSLQVLLALSVTSAPAFAQADLSGTWAARNQQEQLIRAGSGPRVVDYTGVPLNDEGRAKALAWSPGEISMLERQCLGYSQPYMASARSASRSGKRPIRDRRDDRVEDRRLGGSRHDDDLDGRTASPIQICAARSRRLHDRRVVRRPAHHRHDAHARWLSAPQRRAAERSGEAHHAFSAARRSAHHRRDHRGSRLLLGTAHRDEKLQRDGSAMRPIGPPCVPGFEAPAAKCRISFPARTRSSTS